MGLACVLRGHEWGEWERNQDAWNLLNGWTKVDVRWCRRCKGRQVRG